jgi:hypothetical protein
MADKISSSKDMSLQDVVEEVAIGASRIALIAGVVALSASFLAGEKTRTKIADETNGILGNFKKVLSLFNNSQIEEKTE